MYYMIPSTSHSGKGKIMKTVKKKSVVARGCEQREDEQIENKGFGGSENTLFDTIMIDTCHYICPNPQNVQH